MEFEWDERKRAACIAKHGIDFADAALIFTGPHAVLPARSDVETRLIAVGVLDGSYIAVVFTMRGGTCRIITARKARRHEREHHQAIHAGRNPPDERPN